MHLLETNINAPSLTVRVTPVPQQHFDPAMAPSSKLSMQSGICSSTRGCSLVDRALVYMLRLSQGSGVRVPSVTISAACNDLTGVLLTKRFLLAETK